MKSLKIKKIIFSLVIYIYASNLLVSNPIVYKNEIFSNNIKSVLLYQPGFELSLPIIQLNSDETLELVFDDLQAQWKQYKYTIVLCNADWTPTSLLKSEYLEGFHEDFIVNHAFSRNTRIPYVNYSLTFPNENIKPIFSGNYILKVFYEQNGIDVLAFTKRFYIVDNKVNLAMNITPGSSVDTRWNKQAINFTIDYSNYNIVNPNTNLFVNVKQNGRTDNMKINVKPNNIRGSSIEFLLDFENAFYAGNEFRNFDIKSLRYHTSEINRILVENNTHNVLLAPDVSRKFLRYSHRNDINGRFLVKTDDQPNTRTEAEYVYVFFTLQANVPRTDGDVYVTGSFVNWKLNSTNKMTYNFQRNAYELQLLVKQGFYDYQYVFLPNNTNIVDITEYEGSFFSTSNEYSVWVYYRSPGSLRDELIAIKFLYSRN